VELTVKRDLKSPKGTMGILLVDGRQSGVTLELPIRDGMPGSAIPCGRYQVVLYNSPHFGRVMPLLFGVPNRTEIEIHWGSDVVDTRGCILIGNERDTNTLEIFHTRNKFDELFPAIEESVENSGCWITVGDAVIPSNHDAVQEWTI
jgi:hypothetical protein